MNTAGVSAMSIAILGLVSALPQDALLLRQQATAAALEQTLAPESLQRLYRVTTPLLRAMDHALGPRQVSIGIVSDNAISAANGGGGKLFVTSGLLARADDQLLRAVMAHEIAHEDLGHVASVQIAGSGANMILLEELAARSTSVTLFAGPLIAANNFSRSEESAADRQSIAIVERAGYGKTVVVDALAWAAKNSPASGAFHGAQQRLDERINMLKSLP